MSIFKRLLQFSVISVAIAVAVQPLTSSLPPPVDPHAKLARGGGWDAALLDPLDAGLRAEILRHGDLAQATYDAFDGRYWSPNCGTSLHGLRRMLPALGLAGHGYVATAFIYATCDVDIPRWLMTRLHADAWDDHANWAGYGAGAGAEEASRVGHRDVVVVWRGTMSAEEWFMNLRTGLVPFDAAAEGDGAMVAEGFHTLYTSSNAGNKYGARSARDQVADELKRLVDHFGKRGEEGLPPRTVSVLRVVVKTALVPTVPRTALEASVSGVLGGLWALAGLRQAFEYVHVGHELALNVSKSPHLKDSHDPVGSHNLELCLHLLDGHESAAGAFRREDGAPRRDVALVNKRSAMLRDTEGIPEKWSQTANKGLERDGSGRWVLPARERDDMPANDVLPLSELD
uniref:Fungal lipase-type domain-containing protein n=1 Tax=Aegilops tauschii TaxID=37682 RepID=M8BRE8_AEGTA